MKASSSLSMATAKDQEKEQQREKTKKDKKKKRDHMHQAATGTLEDDLWLPSKVHRQAEEPATVSDYEQ